MLVTLRPAVAADRFMIRRWLGEPDVRTWWGNRAAAEAAISIALDSPSTLCRIISVGDIAVGYGHAMDVEIETGSNRHKGIPVGTYAINLFVAHAEHRGSGVGAKALQLLAAEAFATTLAPACTIMVAIRNEKMVRALEKQGFKWSSIRTDRLIGPQWVMVLHRPGG